jgi:dihydropteroate synthase
LLKISGRLLDLRRPAVMGVLNLTPDSFFAQSRTQSQDIVEKAQSMLEQGADILDIGGYSTRPGAQEISPEEEKQRVCGAIASVRKAFDQAFISVDTFRAQVAQAALDSGADMVNDVSGGSESMFDLISRRKVAYVLMHSRGNPQTMQSLTHYEDLVEEVFDFLNQKLFILKEMGLRDVVVDPGFGFAKTIEQNFLLLSHLERFAWLEAPLMVGLSRKSMVYKTLKITAEEALHGTTALHSVALLKGANILRVHDVLAARHTIEMITKLQS